MSSSTDTFHSDSSHIQGDPVVIDALELPPEGTTVKGVPIRAFPAMESLEFDFQGEFGRRSPKRAKPTLIARCRRRGARLEGRGQDGRDGSGAGDVRSSATRTN